MILEIEESNERCYKLNVQIWLGVVLCMAYKNWSSLNYSSKILKLEKNSKFRIVQLFKLEKLKNTVYKIFEYWIII